MFSFMDNSIGWQRVNSLLPGLKLEWPIFTAVLPIPGHERVKDDSGNSDSCMEEVIACTDVWNVIVNTTPCILKGNNGNLAHYISSFFNSVHHNIGSYIKWSSRLMLLMSMCALLCDFSRHLAIKQWLLLH